MSAGPLCVLDGLRRSRAQGWAAGPGPVTDGVLRRGERALTAGPWTVCTKSFVPPGADRHDFVHIAEYAWPDPDRPDGLPWVIRDGEVNPAAATLVSDGAHLREMSRAVRALALAAWIEDDRGADAGRFARRAGLVLRRWFIDPDTIMRPRLDHAVTVPGRPGAADWGLARMHPLVDVLDSVEVLAATGTDHRTVPDLRSWCEPFLHWLLTSDLFRTEVERCNNHATRAIELAVALARFVGDGDVAARVAALARPSLEAQVGPDGDQPAELARPRALFYTGYNTGAMLRLAASAARCGIDLLGPDDPPRRAVDRLVPALVDPATWPDPGPEPTDLGRNGDVLARAVALWPDHDPYRVALAGSVIAPAPDDPLWLELGLDPARALP